MKERNLDRQSRENATGALQVLPAHAEAESAQRREEKNANTPWFNEFVAPVEEYATKILEDKHADVEHCQQWFWAVW